ncbi:MAG: hypothetical protein HY721_07345 [Planctomycetes bacterium]|nr:hypothetical protein [Planctomycetota bacterium]
MEPERYLDPVDLLKELHRRRLPYLLVGRQALVLVGAPVMTADYDFFFSPRREDLQALLVFAAKKELEPSAKNLHLRHFFSLLSDTQKFDFFRAKAYTTVGGVTFTFEEIYARRQVFAVEDFQINVPSLPDLILTKQIRNSPKDQEDIKYLQVLLERER